MWDGFLSGSCGSHRQQFQSRIAKYDPATEDVMPAVGGGQRQETVILANRNGHR